MSANQIDDGASTNDSIDQQAGAARDESDLLPIIVGASVGGVCCIIVVVLVIVILRGRASKDENDDRASSNEMASIPAEDHTYGSISNVRSTPEALSQGYQSVPAMSDGSAYSDLPVASEGSTYSDLNIASAPSHYKPMIASPDDDAYMNMPMN